MARYYTVTEYSGGKQTTKRYKMSAEMERIVAEQAAAEAEHKRRTGRSFWCTCKKPDPDHISITMRGHSCDVFCTDCGGCRQVG